MKKCMIALIAMLAGSELQAQKILINGEFNKLKGWKVKIGSYYEEFDLIKMKMVKIKKEEKKPWQATFDSGRSKIHYVSVYNSGLGISFTKKFGAAADDKNWGGFPFHRGPYSYSQWEQRYGKIVIWKKSKKKIKDLNIDYLKKLKTFLDKFGGLFEAQGGALTKKVTSINKMAGKAMEDDLSLKDFFTNPEQLKKAIDLFSKLFDSSELKREMDSALLDASHLEAVNILLDKGANPNAQVGRRGLKLVEAVKAKSLEIVQALLDKGADPNKKDRGGNSAFTAAVKAKSLEMVQVLLDKGAKPAPEVLFEAVKLKSLEMVKVLLDKGADLNVKNKDDNTALMEAVKLKSLEMVQVLLDKGADPNVKDKDGNTALTLTANLAGTDEISLALIKKGADMNIRNNQDKSFLDLASSGKKEFLKNNGVTIP